MIAVIAVIGDVLLWIGIIVAAVVGLVLLMPLTFRAMGAANDDDGLAWSARVAWGFGLVTLRAGPAGLVLRVVGVPVRRFGGEAGRGESKPKKAKKAKKAERAKDAKPTSDGAAGERGLVWFLTRRHLIMTLVGRYLRALHVRGRIDGVVGMANPADTARLFQVLAAIDVVLPEGVLAVEVDWLEEVVQLEAKVSGWIWPLQVVAITAWLFMDRAAWRALKAE